MDVRGISAIFCAKSLDSDPFIGSIQDEPWLFRVIEAKLQSILSLESFKKYSIQHKLCGSKFEAHKNYASKCIEYMQNHNAKLSNETNGSSKIFANENFFCVLYAYSSSCQNVYDIICSLHENDKTKIALNMTYLNYELLSEELLVDLFCNKSKDVYNNPLFGQIEGKPWIVSVIESQLIVVLSNILRN